MVLFLKVIAAVVLAIVLLGIVVFFLAVRWFKKLLKESERDHGSPCVVHLNEELHPQWIKTKPALKVIKELEDLGFIRGTAYGVDELKNASLFSMYHPKICSVINRTEEHGITVEFFHTSVDDNQHG